MPMLFRTANFHPHFPKEEKSWGIFIWDENMWIKIIFPIWSKFDLQIFYQAHFDEVAIVLFSIIIINVAIRGKNTSFFKCRNDE